MRKTIIGVVAALAILTTGCDEYSSEARQDRKNEENGVVVEETTTTIEAPVVDGGAKQRYRTTAAR